MKNLKAETKPGKKPTKWSLVFARPSIIGIEPGPWKERESSITCYRMEVNYPGLSLFSAQRLERVQSIPVFSSDGHYVLKCLLADEHGYRVTWSIQTKQNRRKFSGEL